MILDPIDQNIRDQGFNFVPFDRYLANPFKPYTLDMSGGITTLKPPLFRISQLVLFYHLYMCMQLHLLL